MDRYVFIIDRVFTIVKEVILFMCDLEKLRVECGDL